jgi:DNA-binding beta-propeller fold protein YncE
LLGQRRKPSVAVVDLARQQVVNNVPVGRKPTTIAVAFGTAYVANTDDPFLTLINTQPTPWWAK